MHQIFNEYIEEILALYDVDMTTSKLAAWAVSEARFKRRISHVPNLTRELNACEVRRLNQLNSTV